jgi:mRNA interferase MazF
MAERIARGQIWHYVFSRPDKRRPVLVLTRTEVIVLLHTVMVAPITSTVRGAPSEVLVGIDQGLKQDSAVNLDNEQTVATKQG